MRHKWEPAMRAEREGASSVEAGRPARIKSREVEDKLGERPEVLRLQDLEGSRACVCVCGGGAVIVGGMWVSMKEKAAN